MVAALELETDRQSEPVEVPWDDKQKIHVKARIRIELDYRISIEILDWTSSTKDWMITGTCQ
jgi:hypothetical protein